MLTLRSMRGLIMKPHQLLCFLNFWRLIDNRRKGSFSIKFHKPFNKSFTCIMNKKINSNSWNQRRKCFKMITNNPKFGPVILEMKCGIFVNKAASLYWNLYRVSVWIVLDQWEGLLWLACQSIPYDVSKYLDILRVVGVTGFPECSSSGIREANLAFES